MIALERARLRGVRASLRIARGDRIAIMGANGEGKTTLLRLLAGLEAPEEGTIVRHARIAFVPQAHAESLFPWFSNLRNVAMPALVARAPDALRVARRMCDRLHIDPGRRAARLSGGESQIVAVARALAWPSDVVLADEPLSAVHVGAKDHVRRIIDAELGDRALVLVTHDEADAVALRARVVRLGDLAP
jgi:ABC-type nitrate/sulfonate/bicarbonate transport system ATPase subunit